MTAHSNGSGEVFLVGSYHGVDVASFAFEQPDLRLEVLDFLGQKLDEVLEVLPLFVELVLL